MENGNSSPGPVIRVLIHMAVILFLAICAAVVALVLLDPLTRLGVFGSCFEGGCGYAAIFVGFPVIWLGLTGASVALWVIWWRRARR